jgi:23S rRNA (cytosine1962-C5)-methyltransferase
MIIGRVFLKRGRDGPVRGGNPWVFSQAIERVEPATIAPGTRVWVSAADGATLGHGYYNPATTIAVRMLALGAEPGPEDLVRWRLERAVALRQRIIGPDTDCYRLVNGDGDHLSGVVIDRYGDVAVLQLLTAGAETMRDEIVGELGQMIAPRAIIERSQGAVRKQEGLADRVGVLAGEHIDEAIVSENGVRLEVDFAHGQKTGYFLDQRENRLRFGALVRGGASVLDLYCYAGGFTLAAIAGCRADGSSSERGAVVAVDTSARALGWARRNLELNGYPPDAARFVHCEASAFLKENTERFDLVVLDPPPLARSRADASRAKHLYVELNALALGALAACGFMMTFSCSAHFCGEDFVRAVRMAEVRARRRMRLLARLGPGADHPVLLSHAEGEYLTGLLLHALD